jgi:pimeloyl-ACP methyl ester carboxylesterase
VAAGRLRDQVLTATGAAKVDLAGHSQGGMMPRYYLNDLGGTAKVSSLVALAPANYGTTLAGLTTLGAGPSGPGAVRGRAAAHRAGWPGPVLLSRSRVACRSTAGHGAGPAACDFSV